MKVRAHDVYDTLIRHFTQSKRDHKNRDQSTSILSEQQNSGYKRLEIINDKSTIPDAVETGASFSFLTRNRRKGKREIQMAVRASTPC